jgi:hypothetical protein
MSAPTAATATGPAFLSRQRSTLLIAGALLAAVLAYVLTLGDPQSSGYLDPDNPHAGGAQAVARVLADHGVEVSVVRSAAALGDQTLDSETTVLVTSTEQLGETTSQHLLSLSRDAHLVIAEPGPNATEALGFETGAPVQLTDPRHAVCRDVQLGGLEILVFDATEYPIAQGCFPGDDGFLVGNVSDHITLLGAASILENDQVLRADNAGAAVRLLGEHPRLVWYVPSAADLTAADAVTLASLIPPWAKPGLWLLGLVLVGVMFWRGRRLGPLAVEPLPVVVKAIETTRSRGRLYRKVNDRGHAAAVLREGARNRLAGDLSLPRTTDPVTLATRLSPLVGRPIGELSTLIDPYSPAPGNDRELVELANQLQALDREVRRA